MKSLIVTDETGYPIFTNTDRMHCLPLSTLHSLIKENFYEEMKTLRCNKTLFIFQRCNRLIFLLVTDQGENELFLRKQLKLLYDLLILLLGTSLYERSSTRQSRPHQLLENFVGTLFSLCQSNQNILVDALERVNINEETKKKYLDDTKTILKNLPNALHSLLFVGTKILSCYSKKNAFELSTLDILLLNVYAQSHFDPRPLNIAEEVEVEEPIIDIPLKVAESPEFSLDLPFEDVENLPQPPPQPMFDMNKYSVFPKDLKVPAYLKPLQDYWLQTLRILHRELVTKKSPTSEAEADELELYKKGIQIKALLHSFYKGLATSAVGQPVGVLQFCLRTVNREFKVLNGVYGLETQDAVAAFQKQSGLKPSGKANTKTISLLLERTVQLTEISTQDKSPTQTHSDSESEIQTQTQTHSQNLPPTGPLPPPPPPPPPPAPRGGGKDPIKSKWKSHGGYFFERLHLRTPVLTPYSVFCVKLSPNLTLVIINNLVAKPKELVEPLCMATDELVACISHYNPLLFSNPINPIQMYTSIYEKLPGLVHFILANRTTHRLIAPSFQDLPELLTKQHRSGALSRAYKNCTSSSMEKETIYLCSSSQDLLSRGYSQALWKKGDFFYSYRMWIEDHDSLLHSFSEEFPSKPPSLIIPGGKKRLPIDRHYYQLLVEHLFPSMKSKSGGGPTSIGPLVGRPRYYCFELYCLYLAELSPRIISLHNSALLYLLRN